MLAELMMHRQGRYLLAFGALLLLLLALAGCGGSSQPEETIVRMTKKQFVYKLGWVCQHHTDRQVFNREQWQKKEGLPSTEKASRAQLEKELVVVILPIVRDNIHDLRAKLHPPQNQEATFKEFLQALEHGIAVSEKNPSWVATGSFEPFSEARELSGKLGTPFCGQA
jgi:hypothetical protein